jgi:hypothetical protein
MRPPPALQSGALTQATKSRRDRPAQQSTASLVADLRARAENLRHRSLLEALVVAILLAGLATIVYGPHAIHGGFISDAWSARTLYVFAPEDDFLGRLGHLLSQPNVSPRPVQGIYVALENAIFGEHMGLWLAWQGATCVSMSLVLYVVLRQLGFGWLDAGLVAALVLIFPATTSLKFWTAPASGITITLALAGFAVALRAFTAGRWRFVLHGASLALFASSLLLYEVALPLMLASVLVYRLRVAWRPAVTRWLADCAVLLPVALLVTRSESSSWEAQTFGGMRAHAEVFWDQSQTMLTAVVLPLGTDRWYALALIALIPAAALVLLWQLPRLDPVRTDLRRWLLAVAGGLVVVVLGYGIFIPAMDYYTPLGAGIANRINAVPSIGWVLVLYGLVMLAATMAFRDLPRAVQATSGAALLACVVVSASWLQSVDRDADSFMRAYSEGQRVLDAVGTAVPDPPSGSTIWTFGQPVEIAPGVPVFGNTWDMTSSVQLLYDNPTVESLVAHPGTTFHCRRDGIAPGGPVYASEDPAQRAALMSEYGRTYFVDTVGVRGQAIRTPAQCRKARGAFPRSPALPVG